MTKRITIDLDDDFHQRLKIYCAERRLIITNLVRKLLSDEMEKAEKKEKSKSKT